MTHYETAASDLPLSTLSVTERVFEGLAPRLEDVVIIDGIDGRKFTAGDVIDHVTGGKFAPIYPINYDHIFQSRRETFEDALCHAQGAEGKV